MTFPDPDAAAIAQEREEGYRDMLEQRADGDYTDDVPQRSERDELLQARAARVQNEADELFHEIARVRGDIGMANDGAEMWMRALEGSLATAREALRYVVQRSKEMV